ncbi:MAG: hypothetical protein WBY88_16590 [Desulfosarcina sp.]
MRPLISKKRLIAATLCVILLAVIFLAGARQGYELGYADGENRANGWWIDKKARYYDSSEIKRKRIHRKHNQI